MTPENTSNLTESMIEGFVKDLIDSQYKPFSGTLHFGTELNTKVTLNPAPSPCKLVKDFEIFDESVSENLDIKGDFFKQMCNSKLTIA